ncbi:MAG: ribonuclease H family protein [Bacteroidales bacterium]
MAKKKFYVVWKGHKTGIFTNWDECKNAIHGAAGAIYKSFPTYAEAKYAFSQTPDITRKTHTQTNKQQQHSTAIIQNSLAVDAACSGNPGIMEYRGVHVQTNKEVFKKGPYAHGTNNIGEFLALVHGLATLKKMNSSIPIYSDSTIAIGWIQQKKCKTKLIKDARNKDLFELVQRAENWLQNNTFTTQILKWDTKNWGEIPADFGRK